MDKRGEAALTDPWSARRVPDHTDVGFVTGAAAARAAWHWLWRLGHKRCRPGTRDRPGSRRRAEGRLRLGRPVFQTSRANGGLVPGGSRLPRQEGLRAPELRGSPGGPQERLQGAAAPFHAQHRPVPLGDDGGPQVRPGGQGAMSPGATCTTTLACRYPYGSCAVVCSCGTEEIGRAHV